MPTARAVSLSAYDAPGYINRAMAATSKEGQANFEAPWSLKNQSGRGMPVIDSFMQSFEKDGAEKTYDLNKIIYFAERLKTMVEKGQA